MKLTETLTTMTPQVLGRVQAGWTKGPSEMGGTRNAGPPLHPELPNCPLALPKPRGLNEEEANLEAEQQLRTWWPARKTSVSADEGHVSSGLMSTSWAEQAWQIKRAIKDKELEQIYNYGDSVLRVHSATSHGVWCIRNRHVLALGKLKTTKLKALCWLAAVASSLTTPECSQ